MALAAYATSAACGGARVEPGPHQEGLARLPPSQPEPMEQPPTCSVDDYCWVSPGPAASFISAVWAASEREVFAVGPAGRVVRFDGKHTRVERTPATSDLVTVWGSGSDDVYAASDAGELLHRSRGAWRRVPLDVRRDEPLLALGGSGRDDVFAVGGRGTALHYDGERWTSEPTGVDATLRAVWASRPGEAYAVGDDARGGVVLHRASARWRTHSRLGKSLVGVWGAGPDAVFVAGIDDAGSPTLWRQAGARWVAERAPIEGALVGLSGARGKPLALGVQHVDAARGPFGRTSVRVLGWSGAGWEQREVLVASPLLHDAGWSLASEPSGDVLVAGGFGAVIRVTSERSLALGENLAPAERLTGVHGTGPRDVVVVGDSGTMLRYDGETFRPDPSGRGLRFTAIHGAKGLLAASAREGKLLVRRGGEWTALATGTRSDLHAVWTDGDEVFAAGDEGTVVRCARGRCAPIASGTDESIMALAGRSPRELYAAVEPADLLRFDGLAWRRVPSPGEPGATVIDPQAGRGVRHAEWVMHVSALSLDPRGGVLVERTDGAYRVEGTTWTRLGDGGALALSDGADGEPRALYGGSAVGTPLRARRLSAEGFVDEALPTEGFDAGGLVMRAIWSGGGEVFVVGDAGAILHKRR